MKYHVRIVKPAQTDMRETYRYISEKLCNHAAAERLLTQIDKGIQSLKTNPERFPLVRDAYLASKGYRHIVVKNHLVFFIIREEERAVSVMRVLYGRRDWVNMLKNDICEPH
jgi:toxin ParE1/3/4